jgi:hypothetical protein
MLFGQQRRTKIIDDLVGQLSHNDHVDIQLSMSSDISGCRVSTNLTSVTKKILADRSTVHTGLDRIILYSAKCENLVAGDRRVRSAE